MARRSLLWPDPRMKPPFGSVEVDRGHPTAHKLLDCYLFNEGAGPARNLATRLVTTTSGSGWVATAGGIGGTVTGGTEFAAPSQGLLGPSPSTWRVIIKPTTWPDDYTTIFDDPERTATVYVAKWSSSPEGKFLYAGIGNVNNVVAGVQAMTAGMVWDVVVVHLGTATSFYINGALDVSDTTHNGSVAQTNPKSLGASVSGGGVHFNGTYLLYQTWNRALSAAEIRELAATPYLGLRPILRRRYFVPTSTAITGTGAVTLGALTSTATGVVALTGTAATTLGALTSVATGAVALKGQAATTLGSLTSTATGSGSLTGTASITLGALTSLAVGELALEGVAVSLLGPLTSTATGVLGLAPITGTASVTLGALICVATGHGPGPRPARSIRPGRHPIPVGPISRGGQINIGAKRRAP